MPKAMKVFAVTEDGVLGSGPGAYEEEVVELFPLLGRPAVMPSPLARCVGPSSG